MASNPKNQSSKSLNKTAQKKPNLIDSLIESQAPSFDSFYVSEPKLLFHNGGTSVDPKSGLAEFGPFDFSQAKNVIKVGVIGTGESVQAALQLFQNWQTRVAAGFNSKQKPYDPILFPHFPGNSPNDGFRCEFLFKPAWQRILTELELKASLSTASSRDSLKAFINLIVKELDVLADREDAPDIVIITLPNLAEKEFGPAGNITAEAVPQSVKKLRQKKPKRRLPPPEQLLIPLLFEEPDSSDDKQSEKYWNLHHAIKAKCMKYDFGTQIIWESTLRGKGVTQDPASIAWNLTAALYYKAGNIPWQVLSLPDNVCYVGISFYRENPSPTADMQTSLAQVFGAGEGLVLKGEKAIVDRKRDRRPHLTEQAATKVLTQAIELYTQANGIPPKRVVVHKTSTFWPEELTGFQKALGTIRFYDFIALDQTTDIRFMRIGHKPPLRGTVITLAPRRHILYTTGYVPYLRAYAGAKIPRPIEIVEHFGDSPASDVCREILALTKLNWNSAAFANSLPITISFPRSVGRILTEVEDTQTVKTKYRYFM